MAAPNTISIDKLVRLIGTPKCPVLVDVRPQGDFEADPHLIPSSIHCTSNELEDRAKGYGGQSAKDGSCGVLKLTTSVEVGDRCERQIKQAA
jgi:hypothetical protein